MWYDPQPTDNVKCPICGARLPKGRGDWGYRFDGKDYCSNRCCQEADRRYKRSKEYQEIITQLGGTYYPPNKAYVPREAIVPDDEFDGWKLILQNGGTITQIAQRYHRTYDQVHYHLSKVGLVPKGCNKLTWQQAAAIRERARAGESIKGLAEEYGVHPNTVQRILNGETYNDEQ